MTQWKVSFEYVDARRHTQYYCEAHGEHRCHDPATVPDEHWTPVESPSPSQEDAMDHYHGLQELISEGELVRNPRLWSAPDTPWTEVVVARVL